MTKTKVEVSTEKARPWEVEGSPWKTESAFMSWVRGCLRKGWSRHPVKHLYKNSRRFKAPVGRNGREVFATTCEICNEVFRSSETEVDHINPASTFTDIDRDATGFIKRLYFIDFDTIRELCKPCHKIVTLAEKKGIAFEEAAVEKELIEFGKLKADVQKEKIIELGGDITDTKTKTTRSTFFKKHLKGSR